MTNLRWAVASVNLESPLEISSLLAELPAYGYFGAVTAAQLNVPVGRVARAIRLSLKAPHSGTLNIGAVTFLAGGKVMKREDILEEIELSSRQSSFSEADVWPRLIEGGLLHTAKEDDPWILLSLKEGVHIDRLQIANRGDVWGVRSIPLQVEADGELLWDNSSRSRLAAVHTIIRDNIGSDPLQAGLAKLVLHRLAGLLPDWRWAVWAVPVFDEDYELTEDDYLILAYFVISALKPPKPSVATNILSSFSRVLRTPKHVHALLKAVNRVARLYLPGVGPFVASRHIINPSTLLRDSQGYVAAAKRVLDGLSDYGATGMIAYGSLLGAVRTGEFIPHDDDVDLLYFDGSSSEEEAVGRSEQVIAYFSERGFRCWRPSRFNFHVRKEGYSIDLFPSWRVGDDMFVMMEGGRYRPVSAGTILPPSRVVLHGQSLAAPAKPQAFLADRYGSDWATPNPFHEWPWKLSR